MSTHDEIMEVYNEDIAKKSDFVERKFGKLAFYAGCHDLSVYDMYYGLGIDKIVCSEYRPRGKNAASQRVVSENYLTKHPRDDKIRP